MIAKKKSPPIINKILDRTGFFNKHTVIANKLEPLLLLFLVHLTCMGDDGNFY